MDGLSQTLSAINQVSDDVFAVDIDGIEIAFRLPSVKRVEQYTRLLSMARNYQDQVSIYEYIFREVITDDWIAKKDGDLPAGIVETIAKLVLYLGGFNEEYINYTNEMLQANRLIVQTPLSQMKRVICQTFQGYTFEILDKLNYHQLLYSFVQAEKVLLENAIIGSEYVFSKPTKREKKASYVPDGLIEEMTEKEFKKKKVDPRMEKLRQLSIERAQRIEAKALRNSTQKK